MHMLGLTIQHKCTENGSNSVSWRTKKYRNRFIRATHLRPIGNLPLIDTLYLATAQSAHLYIGTDNESVKECSHRMIGEVPLRKNSQVRICHIDLITLQEADGWATTIPPQQDCDPWTESLVIATHL